MRFLDVAGLPECFVGCFFSANPTDPNFSEGNGSSHWKIWMALGKAEKYLTVNTQNEEKLKVLLNPKCEAEQ